MNERSIKKLRRKFILTALISFVGVMLLISATIFIGNILTTASQISKTLSYISNKGGVISFDDINKEEAKRYKETLNAEKNFFTELIEDMFNTGIDSADFMSSVRYFTVYYGPDGKPERSFTARAAMVDSEDAERIADKALESGKDNGSADGYPYMVTHSGDKKFVVCMDITAEVANIRRIGNISLIILVVGAILSYFIIRLASWRVIKPEIRAAERQKQFITNASHELKTPLAVIRANTELEMMMHGEDEWNKSTMNQVDRMTGLIKELVQAAKADETSDKKDLVEVDVSALANESADTFAPVATQDGKKLDRDIPGEIMMRADEEQLRQLINILTDNAIKYCDDGGTIKISLAQRGKGIKLCVSNDYADGKDVDYSRFFERFYRKDESHSIDKGGFGIGLAIADAIVKSYRGTIDADWKDGVITFECRLK